MLLLLGCEALPSAPYSAIGHSDDSNVVTEVEVEPGVASASAYRPTRIGGLEKKEISTHGDI